MRYFLLLLSLMLLAFAASYFIAWWAIAPVAFAAGFTSRYPGAKAFGLGALSIGLLWLTVSCWKDFRNDHILSSKMAVLFHLPAYGFYILLISLTGALCGGVAAWSGALTRKLFFETVTGKG